MALDPSMEGSDEAVETIFPWKSGQASEEVVAGGRGITVSGSA